MGRWCKGECTEWDPERGLTNDDCWAFSYRCHLAEPNAVMLQILEVDASGSPISQYALGSGQQEEYAIATDLAVPVFWCKVLDPQSAEPRVCFYSQIQNEPTIRANGFALTPNEHTDADGTV